MLEMPEYALYEIHESGQHLPTLLPSPSFNLRIVQYYDELALRCSRNFKNNFKKFNFEKKSYFCCLRFPQKMTVNLEQSVMEA